MATLPLDSDDVGLPAPDPDARAHSDRLRDLVGAEIQAGGGAITFECFMELALYAPGFGYYTGGAQKFGAAGDFVTAPEISTDFGRCVARALQPVLDGMPAPRVMEFGAGSGRLAVDLLRQWAADGVQPDAYSIVELSPDLIERQRATLAREAPDQRPVCDWLQRLPDEGFEGVVVANEVLDAMPVCRFRMTPEGPRPLLVRISDDRLIPAWGDRADARLDAAVAEIEANVGPLPDGMTSEINLNLAPWLRALAQSARNAVVLLIDYGYPAHEYYHPERMQGTLVCHYRHRVHHDPFFLPGLQDITANVDFTAVAAAARRAGFAVAGYTTQAAFLLDAGLESLLAESDPAQTRRHLARMQGVKRLTLPGEMGERFKVMALVIGNVVPPRGFALRDLSDRLQ